MLELIRSAEGGYESMYPSETISGLTEMTIAEVVELQKEKLNDGSGRESAAVVHIKCFILIGMLKQQD